MGLFKRKTRVDGVVQGYHHSPPPPPPAPVVAEPLDIDESRFIGRSPLFVPVTDLPPDCYWSRSGSTARYCIGRFSGLYDPEIDTEVDIYSMNGLEGVGYRAGFDDTRENGRFWWRRFIESDDPAVQIAALGGMWAHARGVEQAVLDRRKIDPRSWNPDNETFLVESGVEPEEIQERAREVFDAMLPVAQGVMCEIWPDGKPDVPFDLRESRHFVEFEPLGIYGILEQSERERQADITTMDDNKLEFPATVGFKGGCSVANVYYPGSLSPLEMVFCVAGADGGDLNRTRSVVDQRFGLVTAALAETTGRPSELRSWINSTFLPKYGPRQQAESLWKLDFGKSVTFPGDGPSLSPVEKYNRVKRLRAEHEASGAPIPGVSPGGSQMAANSEALSDALAKRGRAYKGQETEEIF